MNDNLIHLRRDGHAPPANSGGMREQIRSMLDEAGPDDSPPSRHLEGRWRRASLLCGFAGSYGMIVSQGWSGQAQVAPSAISFVLMILALVFMRVADVRRKALK